MNSLAAKGVKTKKASLLEMLLLLSLVVGLFFVLSLLQHVFE